MERINIREISDADLEHVSGGDDKAAAPAQTKPPAPKSPPLPKPPANDGYSVTIGVKAEVRRDNEGKGSGYVGVYLRGTF